MCHSLSTIISMYTCFCTIIMFVMISLPVIVILECCHLANRAPYMLSPRRLFVYLLLDVVMLACIAYYMLLNIGDTENNRFLDYVWFGSV